jgi:hypothetical protein
LRARIKAEPRVQEVTLLDRLHDRGFGALEFQGKKSVLDARRQIFCLKGKILVKAGSRAKSALTKCERRIAGEKKALPEPFD